MTDTDNAPTTPEPDPRQLSMFDGAVAKFAPDLLEQHLAGQLVEKQPERTQAASGATPKPAEPSTPPQLLIWKDEQRAVPHALARSALFSIVKDGKRRHIDHETLASWPDTKLSYNGTQLNQYDLDVWSHTVHLHKIQQLMFGKPLYINAKKRSFLREFGRGYGSHAAAAFRDAVERMVEGTLKVTQRIGDKEVVYIGHLMEKAVRVKGDERWLISNKGTKSSTDIRSSRFRLAIRNWATF